jgi:biopolymer transport protein ExbD
MAMKKSSLRSEVNLNLVPMIDVTSFILLALGILVMSMKKEASLDNILKLPMVANAMKLDTTQLQIYILPSSLTRGGYVNPDSTGLVAFVGKAAVPEWCPHCGTAALRDRKTGEYIPGSLVDDKGQPIMSIGGAAQQTEEEQAKLASERPPAYWCASCHGEISPYSKLEDLPELLGRAKKGVIQQFLDAERAQYVKEHGVDMSPELVKSREDSIKHNIPLMIKADDETFYGRVLQVVNVARGDTLCDIRKFAFVTSAEAAEKAQKAASAAKK